jgi:hypothetical protein
VVSQIKSIMLGVGLEICYWMRQIGLQYVIHVIGMSPITPRKQWNWVWSNHDWAMTTPNFDFDKLKELMESDDRKNREVGNAMFDHVNAENGICTFPFSPYSAYHLVVRTSVGGYNDYGQQIKYNLKRVIAWYEDRLLRSTLSFNEAGHVLYLECNDICFVTIDPNIRQ